MGRAAAQVRRQQTGRGRADKGCGQGGGTPKLRSGRSAQRFFCFSSV